MVDEYRELANYIVIQAVEDWRYLCSKIGVPKAKIGIKNAGLSFPEIRRFFKSDWCALLCGEADPGNILLALEQEREAAETGTNKI